jgi:cobalamin biosynthesis protein CobD/CbiB
MSSAEKHASMQIGALLWVIGTLFAVLEPALILFTIELNLVGAVALSAWLLYTFLTLRDARRYQVYSRRHASRS